MAIEQCRNCQTLVKIWDDEGRYTFGLCRELPGTERKGRRERFRQRVEDLREDGISSPKALRHVFSDDDGQDVKISELCRRYVERWDEMKKNNIGVLFYGSCGTGKSFYSSCIGRALLDRCVTVAATSFPRLLNLLQGTRDKQELIDRLSRYELLILDDLGVERDSPFALEKVYDLVNSRYESELPIIVTTNLSLKELEEPANMRQAQIYSRILERCPVRIKMTGSGRREAIAAKRKELARELLG